MSALDGWREEKRSAYLYRALAKSARSSVQGHLFAELAAAADRQAELWSTRARAQLVAIPEHFDPDRTARLIAKLAAWFGPERVRPILASAKVRGLSALTAGPVGHPLPSSAEEVGKRHGSSSSAGDLRAAVFGASDGLVSNASLVAGMAGATSDMSSVAIAGTAGLLAGAFSMAAGEYVSVRTQREMLEKQLAVERAELLEYPEEEAAELALIYTARGMDKADAERAATALVRDPERALDALAREELGVDPENLGLPWSAALFSFLSFAAGAMVPLLPLLVGGHAFWVSGGATAAALFALGAIMSLMTGRGALYSGLRMLLIGASAGAVTFALGRLIGAIV